MELLGIKFAPLNVPMKRRLETISALFWIILIPFGTVFGYIFTAYIILCTQYHYLALLYLTWLYYDRNSCNTGGRKLTFMRKLFIWDHFRDFFPIKLVRTCELSNDKNYMFCVFPHGILSAGAFGNTCTEGSEFSTLFPGFESFFATLDVHFKTPLFREIVLGLGGVSVSKESLKYVLTSKDRGNILVLIVGGASEAMYAKRGHYRIILKNRKGFIKIAIQTGHPIVPVFSFGENDLFNQVSNEPGTLVHKIQTWMKNNTGFAPLIPQGRGFFQYSFGLIPQRVPVTTVVGKPIFVVKEEAPSSDTIEKVHAIFAEEVKKLFDEHKNKYLKNGDSIELIIE